MKRWAGAAGMLAMLSTGCADRAEPKYAECVKLDASGDTLAAWQACQDAVTADPNSKSGKAAAAMLKDMKPRYDAKQAEEAARRAAKEKEDAELRAAQQRESARIAKAKERVASMLIYEGATASGNTIVLRSEQCDQFGATVIGRALRLKIGDDDLPATGLSAFECRNPYGPVYNMTYSNLTPTPEKPETVTQPNGTAQPSSTASKPAPDSNPSATCYPCSTQEDFDVAWQKHMKCCPVRGCEGDSDCSGERVCCRIPMGTLCTDAKRCGGSDRVP